MPPGYFSRDDRRGSVRAEARARLSYFAPAIAYRAA